MLRYFSPRAALTAAFATTLCLSVASATAQDIPKFSIKHFKVEGNSLLRQEAIDAAVTPFLGPERDFGHVQQALEALENAYRQAGFNTVSVILPEQVLEQGEVQFRVIEAKIRKVEVDGNQHFDDANIRNSLPAVREGEIPRLAQISPSLRVANENPFKKLNLQFRPGESAEEIDARIAVTDQRPWRVGLTLDNTGTPQTGRNRIGVSFQHGNLFNRDQILTLQYQTSPEKASQVNVYGIAYRIPLYELGDVIDIYAAKSDVDAGSIAAGPFNLAITGKGSSMGMRYTRKLQRQGDYDHELVLGIDQKQFENSVVAAGQQLGSDVGIRPVSLQYAGRIAQEGRELGFNLTYSRNLGGAPDGAQTNVTATRQGAKRDYQVLRGGLTFSQALAGDWQWRLVTTAQWANSPQVPGEQFGIGGASSVRGFLEREIAGDRGIQGNLELYTPNLCGKYLAGQACRVVGFYDIGSLSRENPQPGEIASEKVSSAGIGVRWTLSSNIAAQLDYAYVLDGSEAQPAGNKRFHGRIGVFF
ncbi:ShlB/FhaC/HecB family hemolysin secretion/activation protein [Azonexus sp.]|uniref:ShlB/FhaC/HecB family hemolysin secretion/activation protein n=1 Tax=Azonexus sp. TaxID=1872668 RepID=UPI0027B89BDA|nr:ShlB/FhaC/HecB family hemolysin secretion/activation protein [Azonexus sp.]